MLDSPRGTVPGPHGTVIAPLDLSARADEVLAVQALAFGLTDEEVRLRRPLVRRHGAAPGTRALGAFTGEGAVAGFVYGMPNDRSQWWSGIVAPHLRPGDEEWLDEAFVITELHVHPRHQYRGIGRRLITLLTADAEEPRSLLSAIDTDSPARALYRALGYRDLARPVHFPGAAGPYAVMGAPLPLPGAGDGNGRISMP